MPVVKIYSQGIQTEVLSSGFNEGNKNPETRKKIKTFSRASRRRLREFIMAGRPPKNWILYSGTFTIAGPVMNEQMETKLFADWCKNFINNETILMVWRKELQERGASHWHTIIAVPKKYKIDKIFTSWWKFVTDCDDIGRMYLNGATKKMCEINLINNTAKWSRYMQDHMTKNKKNQIAKTGRHWGVVNRKYLRKEKFSRSIYYDDKLYYQVLRVQRRLFTPFKKNLKSPFGYSLGFSSKRGNTGLACWFTEESKKKSLQRYYDIQEQNQIILIEEKIKKDFKEKNNDEIFKNLIMRH